MPEAEAELVEGWWTEYGGNEIPGLLFAAEYMGVYTLQAFCLHTFPWADGNAPSRRNHWLYAISWRSISSNPWNYLDIAEGMVHIHRRVRLG